LGDLNAVVLLADGSIAGGSKESKEGYEASLTRCRRKACCSLICSTECTRRRRPPSWASSCWIPC